MKFKFLLGFLLAVSISHVAFAEEGEKKEEAPGAASDKPWLSIQNNISGQRTLNKQHSQRIRELVEEKKKVTDPSRMREIDIEIDKAYKDFKQSAEELKKNEELFRYRFPEKAAKSSERNYRPQEIPSLDKLEEQMGVEGKLKRNIQKMRGQYGQVKPKEEATKKVEEKPALVAPTEDEKNIREQDSPILKK